MLAFIVSAAFNFLGWLTSALLLWGAVGEGLARAASHIRPWHLLAFCGVLVVACLIGVYLAGTIVEYLPYFRRKRQADQNERDRVEIARWKGKYAGARAQLDELEPEVVAMRQLLREENNYHRGAAMREARVLGHKE